MKLNNILTSERLSLEPLQPQDSNFIFELLNTEGWIKNIGNRNIKNNADAIAYIEKINNYDFLTYWAVKENQNNITIGIITFISRDYLPSPDLGFAFLPQYFGKGFAVEASTSVLKFIKENKLASSICAITLPTNTASIKLLKTLNFSYSSIFKEEDGVELEVYALEV